MNKPICYKFDLHPAWEVMRNPLPIAELNVALQVPQREGIDLNIHFINNIELDSEQYELIICLFCGFISK